MANYPQGGLTGSGYWMNQPNMEQAPLPYRTKPRPGQMAFPLSDSEYQAAGKQHLYGAMEGPYTPGVQQSLINRQADMTAQAEGVQQEQLRNDAANRGLAFTDPGVQAEARRLQSGRQQANIGIAGDVRSQAVQQNYAGGMNAARSLLGATQWQYPLAFSSNVGQQQLQRRSYNGFDLTPMKYKGY